jgi:hypothetical protein
VEVSGPSMQAAFLDRIKAGVRSNLYEKVEAVSLLLASGASNAAGDGKGYHGTVIAQNIARGPRAIVVEFHLDRGRKGVYLASISSLNL